MSICIIDVVLGDFVLSLCVFIEVFLFRRRYGYRDFSLMFECFYRVFYFLL